MVASVGFEVAEPGKPYLKGGLVVDNSVAMRWLVASGRPADQRYARSVRDHIQEHRPRVLVPYLWTYEAANVVAQYVRLGEVSYNVASTTLIALHDLCSISVDREPPLALFELAEKHEVTAYDAAYLFLARRQGGTLATLDKKMRKVATNMGINIFATNK
jgi:predicted nucleic acid-binding protein